MKLYLEKEVVNCL